MGQTHVPSGLLQSKGVGRAQVWCATAVAEGEGMDELGVVGGAEMETVGGLCWSPLEEDSRPCVEVGTVPSYLPSDWLPY